MVSIRTLTVRHTISYMIVLSGLILLSRWLWTYPQELNLAIEHQQRDVISIQNAIRSTHDSLTSMAYDYAQWQISQDFLSLPELKETSEKTKALFQLEEHEIAYLAIISAQGEIPLALYREHASNHVFDFNSSQRKALISTLYPALLSEAEIRTFELFNNNSLMTAAVPIFTTREPQHPAGWIVISWDLYGENLNKLSNILQVVITSATMANNTTINHSQYLDLYAPFTKVALPFRIRCLTSIKQQFSGCMKIYHQVELIPNLFSFETFIVIFLFSLIPFISFTIILRFLIRPIETTTQYLRRSIENNDLTKINRIIGITELDQARITFNELIDTVNQQKDELEKQSTTDSLTSIPNRRALDIEIEKSWNRINRYGGKIALILIDIDHFKRYNDFYGHLKGDIALIKVAQALQLFSRRSDEIAARYGGEEFVLLFQYNNREEIEHLLQVVNKTMEALHEPHEKSEFNYLTLSCGACWIESDINNLTNKSISNWIETADKALYQAKDKGRNQHQIMPFNME
ncbi:MAG: GGDEF domain-containing protein [Oleispira sp.]